MRLRGNNLNKLYSTICSVYEDHVRRFDFKSGEKGRVKQIFTKFSEEMGIRDEDRFDEVLDLFEDYVVAQTKNWLSWNKRSRSNYLGFLDQSDEMAVFIAGQKEQESKGNDASEVVGQQHPDEWEF